MTAVASAPAMRWAVEAWDPAYGAAVDGDVALADSPSQVDVEVEVEAAAWAPRSPAPGVEPPASVLVCDGTLRSDARIWITEAAGATRPAVAASIAAGAVLCRRGAHAEVVATGTGRVLATASGEAAPIATPWGAYEPLAAGADADASLVAAVLQAMGRLEVQVAARWAAEADLVVVDGRLRAPGHPPGVVGYVKSHAARYLDEPFASVVAALLPGQRTPLVRLQQARSTTLTWYLRLPGGVGHPWAGVVRCEVGHDVPVARAVALADASCLALPALASSRHKDPRAPQNLVPVGALERRLRHLLGEAALLERHLRRTAAAAQG